MFAVVLCSEPQWEIEHCSRKMLEFVGEIQFEVEARDGQATTGMILKWRSPCKARREVDL